MWLSSRLVKVLHACLKEDRIPDSIDGLLDRLKQIVSVSGPAQWITGFRRKIEKLEFELAYRRERADT